jgi:hypothetical protein
VLLRFVRSVPFGRASNEALDECKRPFCHLAPGGPDYAAMTKPALGEKEFENVLLKGAAALRQVPAAAALPRCRPKRLF